jgi:dTDP-4-dehydrorhamnose reductase
LVEKFENRFPLMWLIVGGTGQLGRSLVSALNGKDMELAFTNSKQLNLCEPDIVSRLVANYKPSVIINAAAYTNVDAAETDRDAAWRVNAEGAGNLAKAAKACGAILAHVSTDYVFSGFLEVPHLENDDLAPDNAYGESKAAGEKKIVEAKLEQFYIFRTAWLYSAFRKNFVKSIIQKGLAQQEVNVVMDQIGQPTFAGDVAERIVESILRGLPSGNFHVTNSGSASWFDFAIEIYRLMGVDTNLVKPIESKKYSQVAKRPKFSVLSHQRWVNEGLHPMRDWKIALNEALPSIISAVKFEG